MPSWRTALLTLGSRTAHPPPRFHAQDPPFHKKLLGEMRRSSMAPAPLLLLLGLATLVPLGGVSAAEVSCVEEHVVHINYVAARYCHARV